MVCELRRARGVGLEKDYSTDSFLNDLREFHIVLNEKQIQQFLCYYEMLVEWNQMMNLTAITEYEDVLKKHFVDSLSLVKAVDLAGNLKLIDVGTGAGFPGLALKIAFPGLKVTLLDTLNKRVQFLNEVIDRLNLGEVEAIHGRAEDLARDKDFRESYDICVSRAVANLSTLAEYCLPFVRLGGSFVPYKSEKISQELASAENALSLLGGKVSDQKAFYLPGSDIYRCLILIEKDRRTPEKYPRKAGIPGRMPL